MKETSATAAKTGGPGRAAGALVAIAVILSVLALALSYAGRALLSPQRFADRAVATLRYPAVQEDLADRVTNAVVGLGSGDLVAVRPVVRAITGAVVGGGAFAALFRRGVLEAHGALVEHSGGSLLLSVRDVGVLVGGGLQRFAPDAARTIGAERAATLLTLPHSEVLLAVVRFARRVYSLAWILAVLALLTFAGAVLLSDARMRTARQLGIGLLAGGLLVVVAYTAGRIIARQAAPAGRASVVDALWQSFLGGLRVQALLLAGAGAIVAGAASGRLHRIDIDDTLAQGWRFLRAEPATVRDRLIRSAGLIAIGLVLLTEPGAALTTAALAVGAYALYRGIESALAGAVRASVGPAVSRSARRVLGLAPVAVVVVALVTVSTVIATGGEDEAPAVVPLTCNGYVALCNRTLNEVALPATHNSMASTTIPSWLFAQQDGTVKDQLNFGIRGLLIDTYYAESVGGSVRTDLASLPKRELAEREIGTPAVDAALRIRSRLGRQGNGKRAIYLCHGFCEIGAVSLASTLADLRSFLVSNPGDVVVVINQDEGVTPADIERAFDQAGLLDLVYRGPVGPFPTLRTMIDSGQRLLVMAENDAGTIPWYHPAYERALQETPFRFTSPGELTDPSRLAASCRPNRGTDSAPLFLLNHWIDTTPTPRPSNATIVNARGVLLTRAQTCQRIRHRLPNLVAVDFYKRGDVLGVVDALNRVTRRSG